MFMNEINNKNLAIHKVPRSFELNRLKFDLSDGLFPAFDFSYASRLKHKVNARGIRNVSNSVLISLKNLLDFGTKS